MGHLHNGVLRLWPTGVLGYIIRINRQVRKICTVCYCFPKTEEYSSAGVFACSNVRKQQKGWVFGLAVRIPVSKPASPTLECLGLMPGSCLLPTISNSALLLRKNKFFKSSTYLRVRDRKRANTYLLIPSPRLKWEPGTASSSLMWVAVSVKGVHWQEARIDSRNSTCAQALQNGTWASHARPILCPITAMFS